MTITIIEPKDYLMEEIRNRVIYLLKDDLERNIILKDVYFYHSDFRSSDRTNIACIFIDGEGRLCADMHRLGSDVSVNFICGVFIDSLDERILKRIIRAFDEGRCTASDHSHDLYEERNKSSNLFSVFKSVFSRKSA